MNAPASARYHSFSQPSEVSALKKLPPAAIKKFERLKAQEVRAEALRSGLWTAQETARENLNGALRDLGNFDKRYGSHETVIVEDENAAPDQHGQKPRIRVQRENPNRVDLREQVDRLKAELARIIAEQKSCDLGFNTADLIAFLSGSCAEFVAVLPPKVVIDKGASLLDTLAKVRADQSTIQDQISSVESAPIPASEAKARMKSEIDAIAAKGAPDVNSLLHGGIISWPHELIISNAAGVAAVTVVADVKNSFAFNVWQNQDAIVARLTEAIDAAAEQSDQPALSAVDRSAQLLQLSNALTALRRSEEAIICRITDSGGVIQRVNVDPLVILEIAEKPVR